MDWNFTDIHCHIIPDVDDGAADLQASLKLVGRAYDEGIRRMIATPHFGVINPQYDPDRVARNFAELRTATAELWPDMELCLGNEIFLAPGYPDGLEDGHSNTLAGSRYVLVEFAPGEDFEFMYHQFRRLLVAGFSPIFAHAERYQRSYKSLKKLQELVNMGVLIQVNSYSLVDRAEGAGWLSRKFGRAAEVEKMTTFTQNMAKAGLVHFLATDCHDMPGRQPMMRAAAVKLVELVGEDKAHEILVDNPSELRGPGVRYRNVHLGTPLRTSN